jgi:hypothetical protein
MEYACSACIDQPNPLLLSSKDGFEHTLRQSRTLQSRFKNAEARLFSRTSTRVTLGLLLHYYDQERRSRANDVSMPEIILKSIIAPEAVKYSLSL